MLLYPFHNHVKVMKGSGYFNEDQNVKVILTQFTKLWKNSYVTWLRKKFMKNYAYMNDSWKI